MLSSTVSYKLVCWPEGISNNTDPSGGKLNAIIVFQMTSYLLGLFKGFHILLVESRITFLFAVGKEYSDFQSKEKG